MADEMPKDELKALHRLANIGPRSVDEDLVVHEVLATVRDLVRCERPLLFLQDKDSDGFWLHHSIDGEPVRVVANEPSIVRRVMSSGRGEIVNDVLTDPDSSPLLAERAGAFQLVATPLTASGKRIGVIGAINSKLSAFTEADLMRLAVLADQAALAIENSQLRATLLRQDQEIEGLHRMTRLLASSETVDHVIGESVRIVSDLLDVEQVALLLFHAPSNALVAHPAAVGMSDEQVEALRVPLSEPSLAGTVYRTDSPLSSNDARNDGWVSGRFREMLSIETVLIVPLATSGEPMGVLCTVNARKGHFTRDDERLATLLASRVGSIIEVSAARERERALVQKLRETDHTKSEFVSMLAHELKGPMTTVVGFGQILKDQWGSVSEEKRMHILDIITRETGRLSRLVADLLDLSRMEAGTLRYEFGEVDLHALVNNILEVHTSLREKHGVVIQVPEELPAVWGDPDRLRQVLLNLMTNATRYSPESTTITITGSPGDETDQVVMSVRDEGIGISSADRERVFGKFVMLDKPGWVKKGTGLGLYITKGIVEAHGGRMWVESEKGKGSEFKFTLKTYPSVASAAS